MSVMGSVIDKLLAHATALDANYVTTRGGGTVGSLNDEDFPHVFAPEPSIGIVSLPFFQEDTTGQYNIVIVTKDETQEALLVRADAYRVAIQGDRTLTGDVDSALVTVIDVLEDPRTDIKAAQMIVTTREIE